MSVEESNILRYLVLSILVCEAVLY